MGVDMIGIIEVNRGGVDGGWELAVTTQGMPYDRPHDLLHYLPDPPRGLPADTWWEPTLESLSYWTLEEIMDEFERDEDPPAWPDSTLLRKVFTLMETLAYTCHVKERHVRWVWGLS